MANSYSGPFDRQFAFYLYKEYQDYSDRDILNELLIQLRPLVGQVYKRYIHGKVLVEEPRVLKNDALSRLFELFSNKSIFSEDPTQFDVFLRRVIYRTFIDSIRRARFSIRDCDAQDIASMQSHFDSIKAVENKLVSAKIVSIIYRFVESDIRFDGTDHTVCKFIALCKLGVISQNPEAAIYRFRIGKNKFDVLSKYVGVLIKIASYDVEKLLRDQ